MAKVIPTILTDSEDEYHEKLLKGEKVSDLIQVDVIDGKFADNLTIGPDTIKKYLTTASLEIQLMVVFPQNFIRELVSIEHVSRIIVPFEVAGGLEQDIANIRNHNREVGLSLNPGTKIASALHYLNDIDFLLLLAVEPGFSGQKFQDIVIDKIRESKSFAPELKVEIDGGVGFGNIKTLTAAGADFLAVNSALYAPSDFEKTYSELASLAKNSNN